jgi:hypothetical protein
LLEAMPVQVIRVDRDMSRLPGGVKDDQNFLISQSPPIGNRFVLGVDESEITGT